MTRADFVVVSGAIALLGALFYVFWAAGNRSDSAVIQVGSQPPLTVSLYEDQTLRVEGPLGTSIIEINDGRIRFVESPCSGKQCIHAGWLERGGDFAACLPNQISVLVASRDAQFDTINF